MTWQLVAKSAAKLNAPSAVMPWGSGVPSALGPLPTAPHNGGDATHIGKGRPDALDTEFLAAQQEHDFIAKLCRTGDTSLRHVLCRLSCDGRRGRTAGCGICHRGLTANIAQNTF